MLRNIVIIFTFYLPAFGAASCSLSTTANGWTFGSCGCKYNAVAKVDDADLQSAGTQAAVFAKYGSNWATWATQQSNRFKGLGFNAVDQSGGRYQANWTSGDLLFAPSATASGYMMQDNAQDGTGPVHAKDIARLRGGVEVNLSGMKCGLNITYGDEVDPYDSAFQSGMTTYLTNSFVPHGANLPHAYIAIPDEADFLFCIDQANNPNNAHVDCGYLLLARPPFQVTTNCTGCNNFGTFVYSDATLTAKTAFRDYLKTEYSNSISSLNTAWGTSYTTFDTSDAGGLTSIQTAGGNGKCTGNAAPYACCTGAGTGTCTQYQSWGGNAACIASGNPYACCSGSGTGSCTQGTGFLDEAGFNVFRSGQSCGGLTGNGPQQGENWSTNAQTKTDADAFLAQLAGTYAQKLQTAYLSACGSISTCPPLAMPVYDGPWTPSTASVYAAMAPYTDMFWLNAAGFSTPAAAVTEIQGIINHDGNKPVIVANYDRATPDSYINAACDAGAGQDCTSTEAARGSNYVALDQGVLPLKNPNGKFAVIGLAHWSLYDSHAEGRAFGLCSPNDNCYDGSQASTLSGAPSACATNHAYTSPAICSDGTNNQSLRVSSCTSGLSAPTWNTNYYGQTTDGTCKWFNVGNYSLTAEASNWGNAIGAIADFNLAGICDPQVGTGIGPNVGIGTNNGVGQP